jgi:hypothetical protein
MGTGSSIPEVLAQLAEAYGQVGQVEEGLHLLAEALAVVDTTGGKNRQLKCLSRGTTYSPESKVRPHTQGH